MATTAYCSLNDVKNRLGTLGVQLRLDDTPPTSADGDVLDEASREIDGGCLRKYTEANLALSPWVKHRCADIATFFLCQRRLNAVPAAATQRYTKAMELIEKVRKGYYKIPDIPARSTSAPHLANQHVQNEPSPRVVIERARSTEKPTDYAQRGDLLHPSDSYPN